MIDRLARNGLFFLPGGELESAQPFDEPMKLPPKDSQTAWADAVARAIGFASKNLSNPGAPTTRSGPRGCPMVTNAIENVTVDNSKDHFGHQS